MNVRRPLEARSEVAKGGVEVAGRRESLCRKFEALWVSSIMSLLRDVFATQ